MLGPVFPCSFDPRRHERARCGSAIQKVPGVGELPDLSAAAAPGWALLTLSGQVQGRQEPRQGEHRRRHRERRL